MFIMQGCMDALNIATEVWLGYWLFDLPSCRRFKKRWVRILEYMFCIGWPAFNIGFNRFVGARFSNTQTVIVIFCFFISLALFSTRPVMCCLAWAGIYYATVSLMEVPGLVLSGWLTGCPYVECMHKSIIYDYIYLSVLSLLLMAAVKRWGALLRPQIRHMIHRKNAWLWFVIAVAEWWVITYFLMIGFTRSGRDVFIYSMVTAFFVLFLLIFLAAFVIYRQKELNHIRQKQEDARREQAYERIKQDHLQKSRELHDMKHQLQPVELYLCEQAPDKALCYVREMLGNLNESQERLHQWTGHPLFDSILNQKADQARKLGINVFIQTALLHTGLPDRDLSVLLGNLLENAVEAAAQCPGEKRMDVYLEQKGNMLMLRVKNTLAHPPVESHGRFETTKPDKSSHGWGLESVRAVAQKYGGQLKLWYDAHIFEAKVILLEESEGEHGKGNQDA